MSEDPSVSAGSVLDALRVGVLTAAPDGTVQTMNETARALFGCNDATGLASGDISLSLLAPQLPLDPAAILADNDGEITGHCSIRRQGTNDIIAVEFAVRPFGGDLLYQLWPTDAASRLPDRLAELGHELRTPLNAIIGFAEAIAAAVFGPVGNERYRQYANDIGQSGRHLLAMIEDVLSPMAQSPTSRPLDEKICDLREIIEAAAAIAGGPDTPQAHRLDIEISHDVPPILADPQLLRQIAINLLSNAMKSIGKGGAVTMRGYLDSAGCPCLQVADNGTGMDPALLASATLPYVRGVGASPASGSGLGLYLVARHVEMHGGTLDIESEPGAGTTVTVVLPASRLCR